MKHFKSALSLLLVLALGLSLAAPCAAGARDANVLHVVNVGDSTGNGIGLTDVGTYARTDYMTDEYNNAVFGPVQQRLGFLDCGSPRGSSALFANYLASLYPERELEFTNLGISGIRACEIRMILNPEFHGDSYCEERYQFFTDTLPKVFDLSAWDGDLTRLYREEIADADVLTVDAVLNSFMTNLINRVSENDAARYSEEDFALLLEELSPALRVRLDELIEKLRGMLSGLPHNIVTNALDAVFYAMGDFFVNFDGLIRDIRALNPDAPIYVGGLYNPFHGLNGSFGDLTVDLGALGDAAIALGDLYLSTLCPSRCEYEFYDVPNDVETVREYLSGFDTVWDLPEDELRTVVDDLFSFNHESFADPFLAHIREKYSAQDSLNIFRTPSLSRTLLGDTVQLLRPEDGEAEQNVLFAVLPLVISQDFLPEEDGVDTVRILRLVPFGGNAPETEGAEDFSYGGAVVLIMPSIEDAEKNALGTGSCYAYTLFPKFSDTEDGISLILFAGVIGEGKPLEGAQENLRVIPLGDAVLPLLSDTEDELSNALRADYKHMRILFASETDQLTCVSYLIPAEAFVLPANTSPVPSSELGALVPDELRASGESGAIRIIGKDPADKYGNRARAIWVFDDAENGQRGAAALVICPAFMRGAEIRLRDADEIVTIGTAMGHTIGLQIALDPKEQPNADGLPTDLNSCFYMVLVPVMVLEDGLPDENAELLKAVGAAFFPAFPLVFTDGEQQDGLSPDLQENPGTIKVRLFRPFDSDGAEDSTVLCPGLFIAFAPLLADGSEDGICTGLVVPIGTPPDAQTPAAGNGYALLPLVFDEANDGLSDEQKLQISFIGYNTVCVPYPSDPAQQGGLAPEELARLAKPIRMAILYPSHGANGAEDELSPVSTAVMIGTFYSLPIMEGELGANGAELIPVSAVPASAFDNIGPKQVVEAFADVRENGLAADALSILLVSEFETYIDLILDGTRIKTIDLQTLMNLPGGDPRMTLLSFYETPFEELTREQQTQVFYLACGELRAGAGEHFSANGCRTKFEAAKAQYDAGSPVSPLRFAVQLRFGLIRALINSVFLTLKSLLSHVLNLS